MTAEQEMRQSLMFALEPTRLDVVNESHLHAGHAGSPNSGQSHFRVYIVSEKFLGFSRVERHRLVNDVLAQELASGVHALAITAEAP